MSTDTADVGVVVVTFNSAPEIAACLTSINDAATLPTHIVVVDNASADNTVAVIQESFPSVTLIRNSDNRYYAAASNQALRAVGGRCILLLNPDTVLAAGSIDALARFLDEHPDAAAVAPQLIGPDGNAQRSVRRFPGLDTLWYDLTGLAFLFPRSPRFGRWRMHDFDPKVEQTIDQPMASCLMIRREALEQIGLFDERYPMFFNDVDLCRRARATGYTIYYTPSVQVRHLGGASIRRRKVRMIWMGHTAYLRYLHRLYADRPLHRACVWLTAPFVYLAAIVRSAWWGAIGRFFR
ncbi:MAG TPA: glycosyltransferase family 2 protein [Acidobacteriota bacterium]|nr:glycosyltransferase family 2 protein [Acidobacteriota bacterium]